VHSVVATWSGEDFAVMATADRHDHAIVGQSSLIASALGRLDVSQIARCATFLRHGFGYLGVASALHLSLPPEVRIGGCLTGACAALLWWA
jgi:hypothetical protein